MRLDQQAGGVLVGGADEVVADETTVLDAVLVLPVVVFHTDVELLLAPAQRLAQVILDLRVDVQVGVILTSRAVVIVIYLMLPKTSLTVYAFAAVLGLTWLATIPPTAGLVGKLFGTRYLATLFGMTLLSHQTGAFFGAWLGGLALATNGDYQWMWYADIVLALGAALISLPIREKPTSRPLAAAA